MPRYYFYRHYKDSKNKHYIIVDGQKVYIKKDQQIVKKKYKKNKKSARQQRPRINQKDLISSLREQSYHSQIQQIQENTIKQTQQLYEGLQQDLKQSQMSNKQQQYKKTKKKYKEGDTNIEETLFESEEQFSKTLTQIIQQTKEQQKQFEELQNNTLKQQQTIQNLEQEITGKKEEIAELFQQKEKEQKQYENITQKLKQEQAQLLEKYNIEIQQKDELKDIQKKMQEKIQEYSKDQKVLKNKLKEQKQIFDNKLIEIEKNSVYQQKLFEEEQTKYQQLLEEKNQELEKQNQEYDDIINKFKQKTEDYISMINDIQKQKILKDKEIQELKKYKIQAYKNLTKQKLLNVEKEIQNKNQQFINSKNQEISQTYAKYYSSSNILYNWQKKGNYVEDEQVYKTLYQKKSRDSDRAIYFQENKENLDNILKQLEIVKNERETSKIGIDLINLLPKQYEEYQDFLKNLEQEMEQQKKLIGEQYEKETGEKYGLGSYEMAQGISQEDLKNDDQYGMSSEFNSKLKKLIKDKKVLSHDDINELMKDLDIKNYIGVFTNHEPIPIPANKQKEFCFIVNFQYQKDSPGHYVAFYFKLFQKNKVYFFDSQNSKEIKLWALQLINKILDKYGYQYQPQIYLNRKIDQPDKSYMCGYYAINFIDKIYEDKTKEAYEIAKGKNIAKNDKILLSKYKKFLLT